MKIPRSGKTLSPRPAVALNSAPMKECALPNFEELPFLKTENTPLRRLCYSSFTGPLDGAVYLRFMFQRERDFPHIHLMPQSFMTWEKPHTSFKNNYYIHLSYETSYS